MSAGPKTAAAVRIRQAVTNHGWYPAAAKLERQRFRDLFRDTRWMLRQMREIQDEQTMSPGRLRSHQVAIDFAADLYHRVWEGSVRAAEPHAAWEVSAATTHSTADEGSFTTAQQPAN
jgi:hypothetical protein